MSPSSQQSLTLPLWEEESPGFPACGLQDTQAGLLRSRQHSDHLNAAPLSSRLPVELLPWDCEDAEHPGSCHVHTGKPATSRGESISKSCLRIQKCQKLVPSCLMEAPHWTLCLGIWRQIKLLLRSYLGRIHLQNEPQVQAIHNQVIPIIHLVRKITQTPPIAFAQRDE